MDITNAQATQSSIRAAAAPAQTNAVLSSDFETFLQMLTAQAKYQDPLEPIDSSEYAAQLAQFSMVEQQVLSNDLLQALSGQMGAGSIGQMAGWIGMEARTTAPVTFDGTPLTVIPKIEAGADQVVLIAYNARGDEVKRQQITTGTEPVKWEGLDDAGAPFANGQYSFKVESRLLGKSIGLNPAESYSRVTEARREGEATVLVLKGGTTVTSDDVTALREPA